MRRDRVPLPITFFVDRSLGSGAVPDALRGSLRLGEAVKVHDDIFAQDAPDTEWLAHVGAEGWVALTQDDAIRRRPNERAALLQARSAVFILTTAQLRAEVTGQILRTALPAIRAAVERFDVPLIGTVNKAAETSLLYIAGEQLPRARLVKARETKRAAKP